MGYWNLRLKPVMMHRMSDRMNIDPEIRDWLYGGCADYAFALQSAAHENGEQLRLGRHIQRIPGGSVTHHVFAHNDTHAFDALGAHPLPYKQEGWEDQYNVPQMDIEHEWNPDEQEIERAFPHALQRWQEHSGTP